MKMQVQITEFQDGWMASCPFMGSWFALHAATRDEAIEKIRAAIQQGLKRAKAEVVEVEI